MKKSFRLFSCLGFLSLTLTGCGAGGGSTEPPVEPPTHEHTWADPTYTWSDDYSSCTAERVCTQDSTHKETETANSNYIVVTESSCETDGLGRYVVSFENSAFTMQTHETVIEAEGHDYQFDSFVWTDFTAKAKYACSRDSSHIEYHNAEVTSEITTSPTCENSGVRTYTATYDGHSDTKTEVLSALDHDYQFDSFVWIDYTAQAKYVCSHDSSHIEYHNATVTSEVTTSPACENSGIKTYTATYDGHSDTKTEVLSPSGHSWGTPTYTWSNDYSSCTAIHVCLKNSEHVETETVESSSSIISYPTYDNKGIVRYSVIFSNSSFSEQFLDIEVPILEKLNYILNEDGKSYSVCATSSDITGDVEIQSTYNLLPVTTILDNAFNGCTLMESITIPETIISIKDYAFNDCKSLSSIKINNSVETIGKYAFSNCSRITTVYIGEGVTNLSEYCFYGCTSLKTVTTCEQIKKIGDYCFYNCYSLENINIFEHITQIGNNSFAYCNKLLDFLFGTDIKSIGEYAFYNCSSLTVVTIPESVEYVGKLSFAKCPSLKTINWNSINAETSASGSCGITANNYNQDNVETIYFGDDVEYINQGLFYDSNVKSVHFGESITAIGDNAFNGCSYLSEINIPNSVKTIGICAFYRCTLLKHINLSNVESIGDYAFARCSSLLSISNISTWLDYISIGCFSECVSLSSVNLPSNIKTIKNSAFSKCTSLEYFFAPGVTSIEYSAFYGCTSLLSITAPFGTTQNLDTELRIYFGQYFGTGYGIEEVIVNEGTTELSGSVFEGCSEIKSISFPSTLKKVGYGLFSNSPKLENVTIDEENEYFIMEQDALCDKEGKYIYSVLQKSSGDFQVENGINTICNSAFLNCSLLTNISLPNSVTTIEQSAFNKCSSLVSITIDRNVSYIGHFSFANCSSLELINYEGTIEEWNDVYLGYNWNVNTLATVVHCSDGNVNL